MSSTQEITQETTEPVSSQQVSDQTAMSNQNEVNEQAEVNNQTEVPDQDQEQVHDQTQYQPQARTQTPSDTLSDTLSVTQQNEHDNNKDVHQAPSGSTISLPLRILAEFAGVFVVCFTTYAISTYVVALAGSGMALLLIALSIAASYGLATVLFARFSGAHLNPAVTIAQFLIGKIQILDAVLYILAQILGGIAAAALLVLALPTSSQLTLKVWVSSTGLNTAVNGFGEGSPAYAALKGAGASFTQGSTVLIEVLATILVVAVTVSTMRNAHDQTSGETQVSRQAVAAGVAYALATIIAFPVTGAALNPARATGIALFTQGSGLTVEPLSQLWFFWVCALLGGIIVALIVIITRLLHQQFMTAPATVLSEEQADTAAVASDEASPEAHAPQQTEN